MSTGPKRPLITANMVTLARLIPMPLLSWWIYEHHLWTALWVGTLIGCTDFVDGYLARRHGPTVLGGLLDPIADKVFIAFIYLPFADLGTVPAWAVALMFVRELMVTALRSAYEQRNLTLKTSYLAKAKTWTQMQGIGVLILFPLIGDRPLMTGILIFGIAAPLVAMAAIWLIKRYFWRGALFMSATFVGLLVVHLQHDIKLTMFAIMLAIVAITWISGFDYIIVGMKQLRGRGDFGRADAVRLLGGLTVPLLVFAVLVETPAASWPLIMILSLELAVGGLDNLLSHHQQASGAIGWGARVMGASAILGIALAVPSHATTISVLAAAVSTAGVCWEFWRGRDYYVDQRIRDKALRGSVAASS